jgi:hypothetical protein
LHDYYQSAGNGERAREADKRRPSWSASGGGGAGITLEAIDGLSETNYVLNTADTSSGQKAAEQVAARFYTDVAPKINVREAQRALERAARNMRRWRKVSVSAHLEPESQSSQRNELKAVKSRKCERSASHFDSSFNFNCGALCGSTFHASFVGNNNDCNIAL